MSKSVESEKKDKGKGKSKEDSKSKRQKLNHSKSQQEDSLQDQLQDGNVVEEEEIESETEAEKEQKRMEMLDKLEKKLHHILKSLIASAKRAKTFEVQRNIKKLKSAKSGTNPSSSTISESQLQSELDAFKKLDLNELTSKALIAKCVKGKLLPKHLGKEEEETMKETYPFLGVALKNQSLKEHLLAESNRNQSGNGEVGDEAGEKARARLTSSKILAEETSKSVENLSRILGLNLEKKSQDLKSNVEEQEPVDDDQLDKKKKPSKKDEEITQPASSSKKQSKSSNDTSWMENRSWSGSDGEDASEGEDYQYASTSKSRLPAGFESQDEDEDEDEEDGGGEDDEEVGSDFGEEWNALVAPPSSAEESEEEDHDEDSTDSEEELSNGKNPKSSSKNKLNAELPSKSKSKSQTKVKKSKNQESTADQESSSEPEPEEESESGSDSGSESDSSTKNLPTLSSGFIQSGLSLRQKKRKDRGSDEDDSGDEESEWSDAEADLMAVESDAEEGGKAKGTKKDKGGRKNRMGQRARKALWEKKFGKNANHIKLKTKDSKAERAPKRTKFSEQDSTTDPKGEGQEGFQRRRRGPPPAGTPWEKPEPVAAGRTWGGRAAGEAEELGDGREIKKKDRFDKGGRGGSKSTPSFNTSRPSTTSNTFSKPASKPNATAASTSTSEMHPSWIAKQRQKQMVALASAGAGQGKKITFD